MEIITECGTFGSFRDVLTHMRVEHLETIRIVSTRYWGIPVVSAGVYTMSQIDYIINAD